MSRSKHTYSWKTAYEIIQQVVNDRSRHNHLEIKEVQKIVSRYNKPETRGDLPKLGTTEGGDRVAVGAACRERFIKNIKDQDYDEELLMDILEQEFENGSVLNTTGQKDTLSYKRRIEPHTVGHLPVLDARRPPSRAPGPSMGASSSSTGAAMTSSISDLERKLGVLRQHEAGSSKRKANEEADDPAPQKSNRTDVRTSLGVPAGHQAAHLAPPGHHTATQITQGPQAGFGMGPGPSQASLRPPAGLPSDTASTSTTGASPASTNEIMIMLHAINGTVERTDRRIEVLEDTTVKSTDLDLAIQDLREDHSRTLAEALTKIEYSVEDKFTKYRNETDLRFKNAEIANQNRIGQIKDNIVKDEAFRVVVNEAVGDHCAGLSLEENAAESIKESVFMAMEAKFGGTITSLQAEITKLKEAKSAPQAVEISLMADATFHYQEMNEYRRAISNLLSAGRLRLTLTDAELYVIKTDDKGEETIEIDHPKLERRLQSKMEAISKPYKSRNNNVLVQIKLYGRYSHEMSSFVKSILSRRKDIAGMAICAVTPPIFNIDGVLDTWQKAEVIAKFDTNLSGYYIVYINDGDTTLRSDENNARNVQFYRSCSRINVANPRALARLTTPSITNLRILARGKHFVGKAGGLRTLPRRFSNNEKHYRDKVNKTVGADVPDASADDRLRKLIRDLADINNSGAGVGRRGVPV